MLGKYLNEIQQGLTFEDEVDALSIKDEIFPVWMDHINYINSIANFRYITPTRKLFDDKLMEAIKANKKVTTFTVREGGKLVGYIMVALSKNGKGGWVISFHLLEEYRGGGTGSKLFKKALKWLWGNGVKEIELTAMGGNERVVKFYRKHGLEIQSYNLRHKKSKY